MAIQSEHLIQIESFEERIKILQEENEQLKREISKTADDVLI